MLMTKGLLYLGATVGGGIGGYLPIVFGASGFSGWTIIGSFVGGVFGLWAAYKFVA